MSFLTKPHSELKTFHDCVRDDLELAELPAFLRVLITTDGTVTSSLEAYFWEPVTVETKRQVPLVLAQAEPAINAAAGDEVLLRQVQLRGQYSNTVFVEARSLIRMDLLPENIRADLKKQKLGIGELLRDCELETYREILEVGKDEQCHHVWRKYRIVMEHRPFIQITESFPLNAFQTH
ncbi:MAG: chorismate pyruvate-lyase family protein [Agarilytica sp.]